MRILTAAVAALSLMVLACNKADRTAGTTVSNAAAPTLAPEDIRAVSPALERYRQGTLGDLWKRPDLSPRDRSIVTVAALIARNQTVEMPYHHFFPTACGGPSCRGGTAADQRTSSLVSRAFGSWLEAAQQLTQHPFLSNSRVIALSGIATRTFRLTSSRNCREAVPGRIVA